MRSRHVAALAAVAVLAVTGCTSPDQTADRSQDRAEATHDGAVPLSTLITWLQAFRRGNGDLVCGLSTTGQQEALVAAAETGSDADVVEECSEAVAALKQAERVPARVVEYRIESAEDETTVIELVRTGEAGQTATLVSADGGRWLLDSLTDGLPDQ